MKAVLVIDKPKTCKECPLWVHTYYTDWGRTSTTEECCAKKIKEDCPLKPLPPHEKALMFGSEFETFSEKVGEIVLDAIEETDIDKGEENNV